MTHGRSNSAKMSLHACCITQTHTNFQRPHVRDYMGGPVPEETFTHSSDKHPPCSIYVSDSPFPQPLSRSSFVFLLVLLHTSYTSSLNHHLLFATHAHTIYNTINIQDCLHGSELRYVFTFVAHFIANKQH